MLAPGSYAWHALCAACTACSNSRVALPVLLPQGNVMYESYDRSTVIIGGTNNIVRSNLALGTSKVRSHP